ncbi:3-hydroxyacyl-CoA dehydrogenase [Szabonella alba]|uniref:3-hydroxybutyryl-CoA dehydrogenase n=1 Tax=Szabonella alba TaxID=2804194 RepID=A0A8K0Y0N9_9RHOB|nr:3-hydroxyacyl-CoA dehydrogenase NAD-binding domain-containing protein [Szabonella alba]MBL4917042.1 3-hydroxybutyryl-CoA dehydrogenase [Szabonella alba]
MTVIGVAGLGVMGLGIAQTYAAAGFDVLATDTEAGARQSALQRLRAGLAPRVAAGKMTAAALDALCARIRVVDSVVDFTPCALVIEAIAEQIEAKRALFHAIAGAVPQAVLATNTSSLSVAAIRADLPEPARLLGLHFFNPAPVMKLVELVETGADPQALAVARALTEGAGKVVIDCADRPGFIVNRCARPYYGEALALLEEGHSALAIDAAMRAAGYRLGPFALIDLIGADINLAASEQIHAAMGGHPRYHVFDALRAQVASGDLGRKTGRGFVTGPTGPDTVPPDTIAPDPALALRIEALLANEAATLLEEGGVTAKDIDTALRLGLNFPQGPFAAAQSWGAEVVARELARLERAAPPALKPRYRLCPALIPALEQARNAP